MDKESLEKIKQKLLEEKEKLENALAGFTKKTSVEDDYKAEFPDFGNKEDENAAEVATFSDRLSLEQNLELSLRDVNKALQYIEKDDYGKCKYCGEDIDARRLMVRPTSSSCVQCKKRLKGEL
ncbi:TraR/DksA C4-type zinc finger protein [Patescibacteria group bacterium]|nr:TraR/DksA C4-type zinc finger protein [Patescibacteria group bacterium]